MKCPKCGEDLPDEYLRARIADILEAKRNKMHEAKEHISNYAQYELLGILVDTFRDGAECPEGEGCR